MTIVKLPARDIQTAAMTRDIVHNGLVFDHFRDGRLSETRECSDRGVCCGIAQSQQTDIDTEVFSVQTDRP